MLLSFMNTYLVEPRYSQPDVLRVTRLKAAVLQTWVNRSAIELAEQNPGYGRRRSYSALDVVRLAVMRRMADMRVDLSVAKEIAEAAAENLTRHGRIHWNQYIFLRPTAATEEDVKFEVIMASGMSKLTKYGATIGDPAYMRVSDLVEPDRFIFPRRPRVSLAERLPTGITKDVEDVDDVTRERLARAGVHAEPVIVFPIGEIANGALAQLRAIDEATANQTTENEEI
jgi:hypothetical protein